jgi:4-amino-4-deoxy-L-arabinose transferase-like glycosyltransferase
MLVVLCAILYLPGITTLPPFDRDESRFAQASKQMVESGDYTSIRFQNTPRHKKPVGIYWLQSLSVQTFDRARSFHILFFRIPSVICATLAVLLFYLLAYQQLGSGRTFLAAIIVASTVSAVAEAHLATTDSALLLGAVLAMTPLASLWGSQGTPNKLSFPQALCVWGGLAVGILIKGPVLPAVAFLAGALHAVRTRSLSWIWLMRPLWGVPLLIAIVAPWFIAIQNQTHGGFLSDSVRGDILPKLLGVHESHRGFPGFYTLTSFVSFWPWSFLILPTGIYVYKRWRDADYYGWVCWLVPAWIALEIAPTKLPHYTLPLFPPLAALTTLWVSAACRELPKAKALRPSVTAWSILTLGLGIITIGAPLYFSKTVPIAACLGAIFIVVGGISLLVRRDLIGSLRVIFGAPLILAVIFFTTLFTQTLPNLGPFWASKALLSKVSGDTAQTIPLASAGFQEPSLVFLRGTSTLLTDGAGAARFLREQCPSVAFIAEKEQNAFVSARKGLGLLSRPLASERVFNYSKGKWQNITIEIADQCESK